MQILDESLILKLAVKRASGRRLEIRHHSETKTAADGSGTAATTGVSVANKRAAAALKGFPAFGSRSARSSFRSALQVVSGEKCCLVNTKQWLTLSVLSIAAKASAVIDHFGIKKVVRTFLDFNHNNMVIDGDADSVRFSVSARLVAVIVLPSFCRALGTRMH